MFDLTNQFNQVFVFTLVIIGALIIVAFGTYLIILLSFRLPFLFWVRHEVAAASSPAEALNPPNIMVTNCLSDRPRMAA